MSYLNLLALPVMLLAWISYSTRQAQAPVMDMPAFTERDATDQRPRVHQVKLYYDRIGPEFEAYRQPRCQTPGTIYYVDGKCWRPERILKHATKDTHN